MNYIQLEFEVYQREKMLIFKMDRNSGGVPLIDIHHVRTS